MTPAERVVVEAALRYGAPYSAKMADPTTDQGALVIAIKALEAERADPSTPKEVSLTWGQVVVDDEIYSDKTKTWYRVTGTVALTDGQRVKVWATGLPKPIQPLAGAPVLVRRGEMGQAVDVFDGVIWSGQNAPDPRTPEVEGDPDA